MNSLQLRVVAERVFEIACNYPPETYRRSSKVPSDERRLRQIEEELKEFQREIRLWMSTHGDYGYDG